MAHLIIRTEDARERPRGDDPLTSHVTPPAGLESATRCLEGNWLVQILRTLTNGSDAVRTSTMYARVKVADRGGDGECSRPNEVSHLVVVKADRS